MTIQLDLELLKSVNISVAEWVAIMLIHKNQTSYIFDVCDEVDFDKLQENGWLRMIGDDPNEWVARGKFTDLIEDKIGKSWYELCSHMPFKVPGPSGSRALRAKDPDAKSNDKAKKMYLSIVKNNKPLHDKIIKCVAIQVRTTDIGYLQNLETWIRNRTWEKYEDLIITSTDIEKKTKETYGQKLI
tara:strand:+ start:251 stop:808 length:558 start_codon:yes stop_codon:yes gene_type:complete